MIAEGWDWAVCDVGVDRALDPSVGGPFVRWKDPLHLVDSSTVVESDLERHPELRGHLAAAACEAKINSLGDQSLRQAQGDTHHISANLCRCSFRFAKSSCASFTFITISFSMGVPRAASSFC